MIAFSISIPINYEDTDAGGIVYYANYLAYMERARNAYLRESGYSMGSLAEEFRLLFVVKEANLRYIAPAKLDDNITVTLKIKALKGASILFEQNVLKNGDVLVEGLIRLALLNSDTFKPRKIPDFLREFIERSQVK